MTEDELDQLEAALVAVARRLKQLGKDSAEAERSRALTLRRIGDLLGPSEMGGPDGSFRDRNEPSNPAERKRRHSARLLSEFAELVDAELAKDKPVSLSRLCRLTG